MHLAKFPELVLAFSLALLTSAPTSSSRADGKLDHIGQQVRRDAPSRSSSSTSGSSCCATRRHHGGHGSLDQAAGQLFAYVVFSPWILPNLAIESGRPRQAAYAVGFADYPYAGGTPGFLHEVRPLTVASIDGDMMLPEPVPCPTQRVAARLGVETGFDGRIIRHGFDARVQFPMRLELDTDWSLYREPDAGGVDSTWIGREHLTVRFAESSAIQFRSGFGPQHLRDAVGWVHGFDCTWGFEAFPGRPVVVSFDASAGLLGKAFAAGLYGRIGVTVGPFEVSAGWHQRWIAETPLGAPFLAARFWL